MAWQPGRVKRQRARMVVAALLLIAAAYGIDGRQKDAERKAEEQKRAVVADVVWKGQLAAMKLTRIEAKYRKAQEALPCSK